MPAKRINLRNATFLLLLGSVYTILHKVALALFPALGSSGPGRSVTTALWIVATATLMLFAYRFLTELSPRHQCMKPALVSIILFTGVVILAKVPLGIWVARPLTRRLVFDFASLLNSFAILLFASSLATILSRQSALWRPTRALLWACGATCLLGIIPLAYLLNFLITGAAVTPSPFWQPLAMLVFGVTYGATIWFLIVFYRLPDYDELLQK
jgi:hypothetical protein